MYEHNNNKKKFIYIKKLSIGHRPYASCILLSSLFPYFFLLLYFCVLFYIQYLLYGALARRNIIPFFFISLTKKSSNACCLVTKQYRMHEQKNIEINRESACVYVRIRMQ